METILTALKQTLTNALIIFKWCCIIAGVITFFISSVGVMLILPFKWAQSQEHWFYHIVAILISLLWISMWLSIIKTCGEFAERHSRDM